MSNMAQCVQHDSASMLPELDTGSDDLLNLSISVSGGNENYK